MEAGSEVGIGMGQGPKHLIYGGGRPVGDQGEKKAIRADVKGTEPCEKVKRFRGQHKKPRKEVEGAGCDQEKLWPTRGDGNALSRYLFGVKILNSIYKSE